MTTSNRSESFSKGVVYTGKGHVNTSAEVCTIDFILAQEI